MDKAKNIPFTLKNKLKGTGKNEDTNKCCVSYQVSDLGGTVVISNTLFHCFHLSQIRLS